MGLEHFVVRAAIEEIPGRLVEHGDLSFFHVLKVDIARIASQAGNAAALNPAPLGERF
jgi:hypothetical protein